MSHLILAHMNKYIRNVHKSSNHHLTRSLSFSTNFFCFSHFFLATSFGKYSQCSLATSLHTSLGTCVHFLWGSCQHLLLGSCQHFSWGTWTHFSWGSWWHLS